jgi:MFS family permease
MLAYICFWIVIGVGIGLSSVCVAIYIAETSPLALRGQLGSLEELIIYSGLFLVNAIGIYEYWSSSWWVYMLWIAVGFAAVSVVVAFFLPESPRWLTSKNRLTEARNYLCSYFLC